MTIPGFSLNRIKVGDISYNVSSGGNGPALLLLHGYPQTHYCWRLVAPELARQFTVICPDLKGYGDTDAPPPAADSSNYSKRVIAAELVQLMASLGHQEFRLIGHDRGARVGYRMALDHPGRVKRMVMLDILPTSEQWDVVDRHFAVKTYHWGFLAREGGLPEHMIGLDPDYYLNYTIRSWAGSKGQFPDDVLEEYRRCFRRPATIKAACADYRAALGIDDAIDRADRKQGRRISCPVLILWGEQYSIATNPILNIWQRWADDVRGKAINCGHFLAEEAPDQMLDAVREFLREE